MTAILLLVGCLLAGLVIARTANTMTGVTENENEGRNLAVFLLFLLVAALGGLAVFGGAL
jgi:hypothetical protein